MTIPDRIYGALLRFYPSAFRQDYADLMRQAFRDQRREADTGPKRRRLWTRTLLDLLRSAPAMHADEQRGKPMNINAIAASLFGIAAAVFLGRFELRSDDAGVEVFFILLAAFILGCWYPKRAWLWSLVGLSAPLAELIWGHPKPNLNHTTGLALLAGFVAVIGLAGAYSGVFVRKFVIRSPQG